MNPFDQIDSRLSNIESLLLDLHSKPKADNPGARHESQEELLTVTQAAEYLKLQTNTIYVLTSQGRIPFSKKGKRVYFSKKELCQWVKSGRRKTHEELEAEAVAYVSNNPLIKKG
jgi:excisionase family DNA binding protein